MIARNGTLQIKDQEGFGDWKASSLSFLLVLCKDHEPSSSKSACNDVHKDKNVSSYPELKKLDCINESDTDDDDVIPSYGSFLGGGNQLEDEDFDF
ncbi:hypothetical protein Tco_0509776 [Tanacetum coccineum]